MLFLGYLGITDITLKTMLERVELGVWFVLAVFNIDFIDVCC